jgi:hypothetical protein
MAQHQPSEEQIRVRAYEIFLRRGGSGGSPEQDWLAAESELRTAAEDVDVDAATDSKKATAPAKPPVTAPAESPPKRSVRTVRGNTTASRRSR